MSADTTKLLLLRSHVEMCGLTDYITASIVTAFYSWGKTTSTGNILLIAAILLAHQHECKAPTTGQPLANLDPGRTERINDLF